jgi:hypothetical protein
MTPMTTADTKEGFTMPGQLLQNAQTFEGSAVVT